MSFEVTHFYRKQKSDHDCGSTVAEMLHIKHGLSRPSLENLDATECTGTGNDDLVKILSGHFHCEVQTDSALAQVRQRVHAGWDAVLNFLQPYDDGSELDGTRLMNPHAEFFCRDNPKPIPWGEPADWDGHFAIVKRVGAHRIHLIDPIRGPDHTLGTGEFEKRWRAYYGKESGWALFLRPLKQV